jgi:hypothetical protein
LSPTNLLNRKIDRRTALKVGGLGAITTLAGARPAQAATVPTVGGATTWLNALYYGAVGDGKTDNTAALNAACDAARAYTAAANGVAVVYLPAGDYKISNTINVWNVYLKGDGQGATRIVADRDWAANGAPNSSWALDQQPSSGAGGGVGLPAPDASSVGPAPREGTWIEDLWVMGPADAVTGKVNCHLSGVRVGNNGGYSRLRIDGFFAGAFLFSDHEKLLGPGEQGGNYYGIYYGEPSPSNGDQVIADIELDGAGWASIGISANTCFGNASFRKLHLGYCPFGIYKEESSGGLILAGVVLSNVSFEACGNGNIFANGPTGGNADVTQCVFDASPSVNALNPGVLALSTTDRFGRPINRMNAPIDLGQGQWSYNEVLGQNPAYPHPGVTNYSALIACGMFLGGRFGRADDGLGRIVQDGKVFTTGGCAGDAVIMSRGTFCRLLRSSGNQILVNDLVESSGGGTPGCQRSSGTRMPIGVAMHGASNGQTLAVAFSGLVSVRCGTNNINANDPLVADASQVGCVKTGTTASSNIVGVAQQASSNGVVSMIVQGL